MSSSSNSLAFQEELTLRNEQFKVLTEKFLEQRKELFDAKKTDSNIEFVNELKEKLTEAMGRIALLEKKVEDGELKYTAEINEIVMNWRSSEEKKNEKIEEAYWSLLQIEFLLVNMTGGELLDTVNKTREDYNKRMQELMVSVKSFVSPDRIKELSNGLFDEAMEVARIKDVQIQNIMKELADAKNLAQSYKMKSDKLEDELRFESLLTKQIQEKVNSVSKSLEYHKKLVAELKQEEEKGQLEEAEDEEDDEEEEEYDDEEEYEDEEDEDEEDEEEEESDEDQDDDENEE